MMDPGLDRDRVIAAFDRAAPTYDAATPVHQEIGRRLREHLDPVRIEPARILDIGAGTGVCARTLARRYPRALVVAADPARGMLARVRTRRWWWSARPRAVRADAVRLGFADGTFDLVYSNLALHWCVDPAAAFAELARVSAPGALLTVSMLGPDTLRELREAWSRVDDRLHVHLLPDMHDVGDQLQRAGFTGIVMECEQLRVEYPDLASIHRDLKHQGTTNAARERPRSLSGRAKGSALAGALATAAGPGPIGLTYEVVYAHAWRARPADPPSVRAADLVRRGGR